MEVVEERWVAGRILADRYRLIAPIGRGGMGVVWRAEHTRLGSEVAVKLLCDAVSDEPDAEARFLREARACAAIRGPHIVQVLDFGIEEGTPYIAMELLQGESLRERLARERALSVQETVTVIGQVAKGIGRAHTRGIVHRDLSPGNIFLSDDEGERTVKVLDFGLAKLLEGAKIGGGPLTVTGAVVGTASYMSPEQARGRVDVDHRADLWSLAIITFQCLTGRLPLIGRTEADLIVMICTEPMPKPSAFVPALGAKVDAWFARGTRRSPDDRFQSAAEMADALREAVQ